MEKNFSGRSGTSVIHWTGAASNATRRRERNASLPWATCQLSYQDGRFVMQASRHAQQRKACVSRTHARSVDTAPHLIVGLEGDGDLELAIREAGSVMADTAPDGEPVDLCRVSQDEVGLSAYLIQQTKPFYERTWMAKLRSLFRQQQPAT